MNAEQKRLRLEVLRKRGFTKRAEYIQELQSWLYQNPKTLAYEIF